MRVTFAFDRHAPARALATLLTLTGAFAGCADEEDRPRYTAQLDSSQSDTRVNSLSDDDLRQVCASYASYVDTEISFDEVARAVCLLPALVFSADPDTCDQRFAECVSAFPEPITVQAQVKGDAQCVDALRACNGTVAQVEGCVNVNLDFLLGILERFSCRGASANTQAEVVQVMDTASVCADLNAQCTAFTQTQVELQ